MIREKLEWIRLRRRWYKKNAHNHCAISKSFDIDRVSIGKETYGIIDPYFYGNPDSRLTIGSFCSIAEGTRFVYGEHDYKRVSTFPFDEFMLGKTEINKVKGSIIVEDDVWIGMGVIVLSGVTIHQGAVIGAGSVVSKDIPAYAIYAGGEIKGYRFDKAVIERLLEIDFDKLSPELVQKYRNELYKELTDEFFDSDLYKAIRK